MMKYTASRYKKINLLSAAWYIFILAFAAKLIFIYGSQHPAKHDLLTVNGLVKEVRIGGKGESTSLRIESDRGIHRYSSYFGKVWPGMESIEPGDMVQILAERKKLNRKITSTLNGLFSISERISNLPSQLCCLASRRTVQNLEHL